MSSPVRFFRRPRQALFLGIIMVALIGTFTIPSDAQGIATTTIPSQDRSIRTLRDFNQAFIDIAAHVKPTVVTVSTERVLKGGSMNPFQTPFDDPLFNFFFGPQQGQGQEPREQEYHQQGLGSGVIVEADGRILTNNHVVADADSIYVRTFDGKRFSARVLGADPKTDIAVIKINADNLPYLEIGNSDDLQVGEMVIAVGSPMSENLAYTVTQGIVSATGRSNVGLADYEDFIQTDAAINPGNSGGPLVNLDGRLVGLNTAIVSRSGGFQGIGFAVPSNMAVRIMNSLISNGKVIRGWLGVSIQEIDEQMAHALHLNEPGGALVGDVLADSPAGKAGLEAGDVITEIDGRPIENSSQLRNQIAAAAPDSRVSLTVLRNDKTITIDVTLGELPSEIARAGVQGSRGRDLGFTVETLSRSLTDRYNLNRQLTGAVVTGIDQASHAYQAGLREGDVIRSVNRRQIRSAEELESIIGGLKDGDTVLLGVYRDNGGFFIAFAL